MLYWRLKTSKLGLMFAAPWIGSWLCQYLLRPCHLLTVRPLSKVYSANPIVDHTTYMNSWYKLKAQCYVPFLLPSPNPTLRFYALSPPPEDLSKIKSDCDNLHTIIVLATIPPPLNIVRSILFRKNIQLATFSRMWMKTCLTLTSMSNFALKSFISLSTSLNIILC